MRWQRGSSCERPRADPNHRGSRSYRGLVVRQSLVGQLTASRQLPTPSYSCAQRWTGHTSAVNRVGHDRVNGRVVRQSTRTLAGTGCWTLRELCVGFSFAVWWHWSRTFSMRPWGMGVGRRSWPRVRAWGLKVVSRVGPPKTSGRNLNLNQECVGLPLTMDPFPWIFPPDQEAPLPSYRIPAGRLRAGRFSPADRI